MVGRVLGGVGLFFLCGCDGAYYWHLAQGQARVILCRVPIQELLARPDLEPPRREKLELIKGILAYAQSIGLEPCANYSHFYDTGGHPISWNVSASPPDRFAPYQWRFPLVGALPYKGFFSQSRAQQEYDGLVAQGYDALLGAVSAYSTLGFFADPVLSTMLELSPPRLADLLLHELTHGAVYAPDQTDFNESLATFVGQTGSLLFLAQHYGPDTPLIAPARQERADAALFRAFMAGVVASLDSLYGLGLPRPVVLEERQQVFARAKERYRLLRTGFSSDQYDGFLRWEVNNARLLSYRRYHARLEDFEAVYARQGQDLGRALAVFTSCGESPDPWACLRLQAALPPSGLGRSPL
jgi:predicted aminopeptidase